MTFVPVVKLSGITWNSISIRWKPPETSQVSDAENEEAENTVESRNYLDYITYYKLTRKTDDHEVICTNLLLNLTESVIKWGPFKFMYFVSIFS